MSSYVFNNLDSFKLPIGSRYSRGFVITMSLFCGRFSACFLESSLFLDIKHILLEEVNK